MLVKCNCNNCSTHLEFDSANVGEVIVCPTCGMDTKLYVPTPPGAQPVKYGLLYVLLGSAAMIGLSWLFAGPLGSVSHNIPPAAASVAPVVSISDVEAEKPDYGGLAVTGIIKNLSDTPLNAVSVNFSIFNDAGNKVDVVMDFIQQIQAGETWKFKASSLKDDCKTYRLDSITSIAGNKENRLEIEEK